MIFLTLLVGFILWFSAVNGDQNITVDDSSSSIIYSGGWEISDSPLAYDGSHHFADTDDFPGDKTATATFTFTGTAIYYMAPLWPYTVNTVVTLDSGSPYLIEMTDPSESEPVGNPPTVESQVLWGQTGLANTEHTLVMSMASSGMYIVVDALIYTVPTTTTIVSVSTSSAASSFSASSSSASSSAQADTAHRSTKSLTTIVIAVICALIALVFLAVMLFLFFRRKRKNNMRDSSDAAGLNSESSPPMSPPMSPPLLNAMPPELPSAYETQDIGPRMSSAFTYNYPQLPVSNDYGYVPPTNVVYGTMASDRYTPPTNTINRQPAMPFSSANITPPLHSAYTDSRSVGSSSPQSYMGLTPLESVRSASEGTRLSVVMEGSQSTDSASVEKLLPQSSMIGSQGHSGLYPLGTSLTLQEKYIADQKRFDSRQSEGSNSPPVYSKYRS